MLKKHFKFIIACACAFAVFAFYVTFYGDEHNQALASLSEGEANAQMVNYKPARKRHLSARLRQDVNQILDLSGHDIVQIFDEPELVRQDLPTTIWQYRNESCVMDVYFTVDNVNDVARANVAHYEVRRRDTRADEKVTANDCMQELVAHDTMISLIDINAIFKAPSR